MSFHKTNLGQFGDSLPCDINGYVPEDGDSPEDFNFGDDRFSADFDDHGNGYEGYAEEAWAEFVAEAVAATETASEALDEWREPAQA